MRWGLTLLAQAAPVAGQAEAGEAIHLVDAGAPVLTRAAQAVVNVWEAGTGRGQRSAPTQIPTHRRKWVRVPLSIPWTPTGTALSCDAGEHE